MTKEEKLAIKAKKDEEEKEFLYATIDGRKERVGNFRVEPPGLFRGRGEHPKMGKLKSRIYPEDITINIGVRAPRFWSLHLDIRCKQGSQRCLPEQAPCVSARFILASMKRAPANKVCAR